MPINSCVNIRLTVLLSANVVILWPVIAECSAQMSAPVYMTLPGNTMLLPVHTDFITKRLTQFQWMQQMYTLMEMIWETLQVRHLLEEEK